MTAYFLIKQFEKTASNKGQADNDLNLDEQLNKLSKLSRIKKDLSHAEFTNLKSQILGDIYDDQSIINNVHYSGSKSPLIYYLDLLIECFQNGKAFEGVSFDDEGDKIMITFQTRHLLKAFNTMAYDYSIEQPFKTAQSLNANIRNSVDLIRLNWSYEGSQKKIRGYYFFKLIKKIPTRSDFVADNIDQQLKRINNTVYI